MLRERIYNVKREEKMENINYWIRMNHSLRYMCVVDQIQSLCVFTLHCPVVVVDVVVVIVVGAYHSSPYPVRQDMQIHNPPRLCCVGAHPPLPIPCDLEGDILSFLFLQLGVLRERLVLGEDHVLGRCVPSIPSVTGFAVIFHGRKDKHSILRVLSVRSVSEGTGVLVPIRHGTRAGLVHILQEQSAGSGVGGGEVAGNPLSELRVGGTLGTWACS